ncbi:hypothetical protein EVA_20906 [gut metagenome]|uniref:Uncharacterized protein n=1 Tax=gut metagenome TaxID=749906 RepID=J9FUD5_9ZZZZ
MSFQACIKIMRILSFPCFSFYQIIFQILISSIQMKPPTRKRTAFKTNSTINLFICSIHLLFQQTIG